MNREDQLNRNHDKFKDVLDEAEKLRWEKYQVYGNSYKEFGLVGIAIKLSDKVARIKNIINNPKLNKIVADESIRDSAIDLLNYAAMFVMTFDENGKETKECAEEAVKSK